LFVFSAKCTKSGQESIFYGGVFVLTIDIQALLEKLHAAIFPFALFLVL
jgi:hypothetical protein